MTTVTTTLALHLKSAGYSVTQPRQLVFSALQEHAPLSMHTLYTSLQNEVDRTSVYRTVELFEKLHIAQRVAKGWKYMLELTDEFVPHHHHFTCTQCHASLSFDEPALLDTMLESVAEQNGFVVSKHTLEIEGLCSSCLSKNSPA